MDVYLLFNPLSGSGRARTLAAQFEAALRHAGIAVHAHPTHHPDGTLTPPLDPASLRGAVLAVIGGDGTIHRAAPLAAQAGAAIYHIPAGTENLFARHYGMTADPADLVRALQRPTLVPMDIGTCNGHPFVLMASFGPDAGVIHRLHATRQGPISHWSYLRPIYSEIVAPYLPKLSVRVDGAAWLQDQRGMLFIANSPHYALGLNPGRGALADDGLLDAVFSPCDTIADGAAWAAHLFLNQTSLPKGTLRARGRTIEVVPSDGHALLQMDGEVPPHELAAGHHLHHNRYVFDTQCHAMMVLDPVK